MSKTINALIIIALILFALWCVFATIHAITGQHTPLTDREKDSQSCAQRGLKYADSCAPEKRITCYTESPLKMIQILQ